MVLLGLLAIATGGLYVFGWSLRDIHRRTQQPEDHPASRFLLSRTAPNLLPIAAVLALRAFLAARTHAIDIDVFDFLASLMPITLGATIVLALAVVGYALVATLHHRPSVVDDA